MCSWFLIYKDFLFLSDFFLFTTAIFRIVKKYYQAYTWQLLASAISHENTAMPPANHAFHATDFLPSNPRRSFLALCCTGEQVEQNEI